MKVSPPPIYITIHIYTYIKMNIQPAGRLDFAGWLTNFKKIGLTYFTKMTIQFKLNII